MINLTENQKKILIRASLIFVTIIIAIAILITIVNIIRDGKCKDLHKEISNITDSYLDEHALWPEYEGQTLTINLDKMDEKVLFNDKTVEGSVKYTKYKDDYIKTFYIYNCGYCTVNDNWGKESNKYYKNKTNVDVIAYYNYYTVGSYNSKWSNWLASLKVSTELTNGVYLPLDSKNLPNVPDDAIITLYEKEDKTYYSYRDKQWKWYKNNINYSVLSSEQPSVKSYRTISTKTGYRWYYVENGKKIYWNDGAYYPTKPEEIYTEKSKENVKMYSYVDKMWKWYNGGTKRVYSSFSSIKNSYYNYQDVEINRYTNWSTFKETSYLDNNNSSYREEKTDIYSRYRIQYQILSFLNLDNSVKLDEFESILGKSLEDALNDNTIKVEVTYKFMYQ